MRTFSLILAVAILTLATTASAAQFHVFAPDGRPLPVSFRPMTLAEGKLLLVSDESDEVEANTNAYWADHTGAYFRWDLQSGAEVGLVTDMARNVFTLEYMGLGDDSPDALPQVVTAEIDGQERIVAIGTFGGEVHFISDSELWRKGYRGMGTALVVFFLQSSQRKGQEPFLTSVNGSYGFYEKVGFRYCSDEHTPATVADPSLERFDMFIPQEEVEGVLQRLAERDSKKVQFYELQQKASH